MTEERQGLRLSVPRELQVTIQAHDGLPITMPVQAPVEYAMDGLVTQHAWLRQGEDKARGEYAAALYLYPSQNAEVRLTDREAALLRAVERLAFVRGRMVGMDDAVGYLLGGPNALRFNSSSYQEYSRRLQTNEQTHESAFGDYAQEG